MLYIKVSNDKQHAEFRQSGKVYFGRSPHDDYQCIVIKDPYVSRCQLIVEELEGGEVALHNSGRTRVYLSDGSILGSEHEVTLPVPTKLRVGGTTINIACDIPDTAKDLTRATLDSDTSGIIPTYSFFKHYPYPLSYSYQMISSFTTPAELYKQQLRLAENMLAFVGSVSLAILDDEDLLAINEAIGSSALDYWRGGISPGDWLSLMIHATSRMTDCPPHSLAGALAGLQVNKSKKGFGKTARMLLWAKNDYKHDRGPSVESEYISECERLAGLLNDAFESLMFLTSHPIRKVKEVNPHRRGHSADVVFLNCMDDHPGFASEYLTLTPNFRKGDLYIELEPDNLQTLFPFLTATTCQQCKMREFFFIDRIDERKKGSSREITAGLKSFERGHVASCPEVGEEFLQLFSPA